jgi:hypothetical protein
VIDTAQTAKCPTGTTALSWNQQGVPGPPGPSGALQVVDANSKVLGAFIGYSSSQSGPDLVVLSGGLIWKFNVMTGARDQALDYDQLDYTSSNCSGPAYMANVPQQNGTGGPGHSAGGDPAYTPTGPIVAIVLTSSRLPDGSCLVYNPPQQTDAQYRVVTSTGTIPGNGVGPLTIRPAS